MNKIVVREIRRTVGSVGNAKLPITIVQGSVGRGTDLDATGRNYDYTLFAQADGVNKVRLYDNDNRRNVREGALMILRAAVIADYRNVKAGPIARHIMSSINWPGGDKALSDHEAHYAYAVVVTRGCAKGPQTHDSLRDRLAAYEKARSNAREAAKADARVTTCQIYNLTGHDIYLTRQRAKPVKAGPIVAFLQADILWTLEGAAINPRSIRSAPYDADEQLQKRQIHYSSMIAQVLRGSTSETDSNHAEREEIRKLWRDNREADERVAIPCFDYTCDFCRAPMSICLATPCADRAIYYPECWDNAELHYIVYQPHTASAALLCEDGVYPSRASADRELASNLYGNTPAAKIVYRVTDSLAGVYLDPDVLASLAYGADESRYHNAKAQAFARELVRQETLPPEARPITEMDLRNHPAIVSIEYVPPVINVPHMSAGQVAEWSDVADAIAAGGLLPVMRETNDELTARYVKGDFAPRRPAFGFGATESADDADAQSPIAVIRDLALMLAQCDGADFDDTARMMSRTLTRHGYDTAE